MSTRPAAAMTDAVAREIVRQYHGNAATIAVLLAETIIADGRWSANVCKPLLRAYEIAKSRAYEAARNAKREGGAG